jgi:hypothetical protein
MTGDKADKDPIMKLGYGMVAYRNMMWVLMCAFAVFSLLNIPALYIYKQGSGFSNNILTGGREDMSLGNLGYSSIQCSQIPLGI